MTSPAEDGLERKREEQNLPKLKSPFMPVSLPPKQNNAASSASSGSGSGGGSRGATPLSARGALFSACNLTLHPQPASSAKDGIVLNRSSPRGGRAVILAENGQRTLHCAASCATAVESCTKNMLHHVATLGGGMRACRTSSSLFVHKQA